MECIVKNQEVECIMYGQAIGTPIIEVSCYYNHIIKVYILMEFLLCDQSVHFNKICSFFIKFLSVDSVGSNFDCNATPLKRNLKFMDHHNFNLK